METFVNLSAKGMWYYFTVMEHAKIKNKNKK
jgi:hypothetical protein